LYFAATDPDHGRELWDPPPVANGYLLVGDYDGNSVLRYNAATGAFVDEFVPKHSGGLNQPQGMVFGPDHNLYVVSGELSGSAQQRAVLRYDGNSGAPLGTFADSAHLDNPHSLIFGPDGNLYVGDNYSTGSHVARYDGQSGTYLGDFVPPNT